MKKTSLIATLNGPCASLSDVLSELPAEVSGLAVRADLAGEPDTAALRARTKGELLYALRQREAGGGFDGDAVQRRWRLGSAAAAYDLVELDAERDLVPEILEVVPPRQRMVAWRGPALSFDMLEAKLSAMHAVPARYYLIAPEASRLAEALLPLRLLRQLNRRDTIAYARGHAGLWTRPLAARLGAPLVFGDLIEGEGFGVRQLVTDFGLPECGPVEMLFGIAGSSVSGSLSPRLHNTWYRTLAKAALYLPFNARSFGEIHTILMDNDFRTSLGLPLVGLTIAAPFKEEAAALADTRTPLVESCGACNMLSRRHSTWRAGTSDGIGVMAPLTDRGMTLSGLRVAVLGCGGAGRAAAVVLSQAGAEVTLVNRDSSRSRDVARRLKLPFVPITIFQPRGYQILVQATPVGKNGEPPLFDVANISPHATVLEYLYARQPSPLMTAARERGLCTIDGFEVLTAQVQEQFRFLCGWDPPRGPNLIPS